MSRKQSTGTCETCGQQFKYYLIHNGFGDSAYAYSDSSSFTCLLDGWKAPSGIRLEVHKKITVDIEEYLAPAPDGGLFRAVAVPRCPHCNGALNPVRAADYIEKNAEGAELGWRWDRNWSGIYCIVIEDKIVWDNWKAALL